ncbi:MAG: DUF5104 domain-containing protein [Clostridiales bacterium]|nr:DUF5104 domain-containing protein [Clostridiales bacterium]
MNLSKSLAVVLSAILILSSLAGCGLLERITNGKYDPNMTIGEQIKTRHYKGNAVDFGKNELLDEILECVEDKDVDRMMELFSDYALEENDVLDEELEELYDAFPEIDEVKNNCCSVSGSHNQGSTEYKYKYQINADIYDEEGNRYCFIVVWIEGYSEDPDMQGLYSIQLVSEDSYWNKTFTVHSWGDRPGVYVYI